MVADWTERSQKALGLLSRFEPSHQAFALPRRLMWILGSVIQPLVPTVVDRR